MGAPGPTPSVTLEDTLGIFESQDEPGTPLAATEVAERLGCARRTAHRKLERLAERGELETKKVGARSRVWWRPGSAAGAASGRSGVPAADRLGAFVRTIRGTAIVGLDPDGRIDWWNEGAVRLTGYAAEEMLGEPLAALYREDEVERGIPAAHVAAAREHDGIEDSRWLVRADGSPYRAGVSLAAARDDGGRLAGFTMAVHDLSGHDGQAVACGEAEQRYRTLAERFPNGTVTMFDEELRYLLVEGQAFDDLDLAADDMAGQTLREVFPGPVGDGLEPAYRTALNGEEATVEVEFEGRHWVVHVTPVRDHEGVVVGGMTTSQDFTERVERERRLEQYQTIVETVDDGIYALDDDLRFVIVNDAYAEMVGRPRDELVGSHISVVVDATAVDMAVRLRERLQAGEIDGGTAEVGVSTATGEVIPTETTFAPLWLDDGTWQGTVGVVRDISEREAHERELRRYEKLIEESADINTILDAEGKIQYVTPSVEYVLGYGQGEMVGEPVFDYIHPEDREETMERFTDMVDGNPAPTRAEFRFQGPDGSWVWLEARGRNLLDDPTIDGVVVYTRDVTERRTYERRLESRARQQAVIAELGREALENPALDDLFDEAVGRVAETLGTAYCKVLELDCDTRQLRLRQGVGWREGIVGRATVAADDNSQAGYTLQAEGPVVVEDLESETRFTGPELLTTHGVHSGISTVIGSVDDPWGVFGTHDTRRRCFTDEDVSFVQSVANVLAEAIERQTYEDELEGLVAELAASNERLEQFAYVASHDLQEPLRMVSSYLQLLEDRYAVELDGKAREFIGYAVDGADRMREMIDDLLAYARVDTQGEPLEATDCEVVVDRVLTTLQVQIDETDATVDVGALPTVAADDNQLEQVFQNLVSNAIKYRGDGSPRIDISADRVGPVWEFQVADNGIGMDPDHTDRIFDVFQRLHTNQEYSGTGIGLALCRRIVERHGGDIWVETSPGDGTTFYFTISAAEPGRMGAELEKPAPPRSEGR